MHKSQVFFVLVLSFVGGVLARSFLEISELLVWIIAIISLAIWLVDYKNKKNLVFFLAGIFFLLGIFRLQLSLDEVKEIKNPVQEISAQARIVNDPDRRELYQNLIAEVSGHNLFGESADKEKYKILLRADVYQSFSYGDEIKLNCQPEVVKNFDDSFDYRMYLAKDEIYYICWKPEIEKISDGKNNFYGMILKLRNSLDKKIQKVIPQPEAGLGSGLLFGKNSLSKEKQALFSNTGMSHIVAVSGYNVTIIAQYLMMLGIFLGLWRQQAFYFAFLGIVLFVMMIGFPSSAVRAGMMGLLVLWAMKNGRLAKADNAIIFAAAIMLVFNPLLLRWDVGFQLSFLATLGLIKLSPIWDRFLIGKHKAFGILEITLMTISAQIFVLPIIFYNFGTFSLVSILANLLVLSIIPATMLFVFLSAVSGFIFYPLFLIFGWLGYFLLKYEMIVISFFGNLKWSVVEVKNFGGWQAFIWYLILFLVLYFLKKKRIVQSS